MTTADTEGSYSGHLLREKLFAAFEELFEGSDGKRMDFDVLCGWAGSGGTGSSRSRKVTTVLLDCMMYEDDRLFSSALAMLERTFGQRECIIALLCEIIKSFICKYAQEAGLLLSSLQFFKRPITNEPLDDRLIN